MVVVRPVDDAPVARPDAATTNEDMPVSLNVLTNDTDPDGNPLTVVSATAPNGTIVIGPDGRITYTPNANFNGTDIITYRVSDGVGGFATSTVTVTVTPVNDAPVDGDEMLTVIGGTATRISVLANASDVDGNPLIVTNAVPSVGTVVINPDGMITYTAPPEFDGVATITYVVSDGMGGFNTSTVTINITQASADINALLNRADPFGDDGGRIDRKVDPFAGLVTTPLIILDAVNGFASLNGTPDLNVRMPILEAVNGLRTLKGTGTLDVDGQPVSQVVEWIDRIRDLRFGAEKLFDPRFGDFIAESLTGFSVRELTAANGQIMIESVVRDRVVYMEVRDIGKDSDPRVTEYQLRMRDGSALPEWIKMDARGLAIIERPADAEEIRLIVRAIRADGQVIEVPVLVQGATGEIQLDEKAGKTPDRVSQLLPFGAALAQVEALASTESTRIANAFVA
jgi:hypothetical protein